MFSSFFFVWVYFVSFLRCAVRCCVTRYGVTFRDTVASRVSCLQSDEGDSVLELLVLMSWLVLVTAVRNAAGCKAVTVQE